MNVRGYSSESYNVIHDLEDIDRCKIGVKAIDRVGKSGCYSGRLV